MSKTETKITQSSTDVTPEDSLMVPVDRLREYENNPRNNDHAVDAMADLIAAHGFRVPILIQTSEDGEGYDLVDGHLRIKAARALGLAEVPAILVDDMPPEQVQAFRIAVNRAAELADWDTARLATEIEAIRVSFDNPVVLTGFDDAAFSRLAAEVARTDAATAQTSNRSEPVNRQADKHTATRDTDNVNLSLGMTAAEREEALDGLEKLRKARGLDTKSGTVLQLIRDALAVQEVDGKPAAKAARSRRRP